VCFGTNGWSNSIVENICFNAAPGGIAFDLNCDGVSMGQISLQSNYFGNCVLGGANSNTDYGISIGTGGYMGSENTFMNCYIGGCDVAGVYIHNFNSLSNSFYGGNIANCKRGIWVHGGSAPVIQGTGFQNYMYTGQIADIYIEGGAGDAYAITGCRSESKNFLLTGAAQTFAVVGCNHNGGDGFIFSGAGFVTLDGCTSTKGYIDGTPSLIINSCTFGNPNYLTAGTQDNFRFLQISPMPITTQTAATYTIASSDGGSKIQFNRSTAQTVTLLKNSDGSNRLGAGTKIEVQQIGTGQVTFVGASGVTIRSSNGLKLRAQHSCATLTCDGADAWTVTGDTTS
jgi:hypothetical protein